jgi:DNA replication ATP-dependent helicase Dna2
MQALHTATAFYARIKEAHGVENTEEKTRHYKQILEILFRELTRKETRSFGNLFARIFISSSQPCAY